MNAGPKTASGGKGPLTGVFAQPLAGDPRAIFRAGESESFSPEKHVISTRAEYKSRPALFVARTRGFIRRLDAKWA